MTHALVDSHAHLDMEEFDEDRDKREIKERQRKKIKKKSNN